MLSLLDQGKDLLSTLIARYRDRVDYLAIRLEESEGADYFAAGR